MTAIAAAFERLQAAAQGTFGQDATYTPAGGGSAVAVRVLVARVEDSVEAGGSWATQGVSLAVRVSEVAQPTSGDTIALADGRTFAVRDWRSDPDRLEWRLSVSEVAAS
jgi:hypothetical protein